MPALWGQNVTVAIIGAASLIASMALMIFPHSSCLQPTLPLPPHTDTPEDEESDQGISFDPYPWDDDGPTTLENPKQVALDRIKGFQRHPEKYLYRDRVVSADEALHRLQELYDAKKDPKKLDELVYLRRNTAKTKFDPYPWSDLPHTVEGQVAWTRVGQLQRHMKFPFTELGAITSEAQASDLLLALYNEKQALSEQSSNQ